MAGFLLSVCRFALPRRRASGFILAYETTPDICEQGAVMAKKNIPYDQKYYDPEIECMPRPELEALQLERLQEMVQYAYDNTVYYKRSFDEAGVKPEDIKTLKDLEKFPFIDKKTERDTQHVGSFFGEMCSVPEEEVIFMATSSGSTGVPTVSPFTQEDFDLWQDTEARLFWQAGMRPNDRYVHGLNFALYVGGPDVIGAQRLGALAIWVGAVPSDRLLFVLKQYQPTMIWTSPSYAWQLGEKAKEKGFDPRTDFNIHTIIVAGEPGGSITSTREAIENLWGAKVVDFFGLSDIYGACAAACETHDGLHIVEDQILVETVDPNTGEVLAYGDPVRYGRPLFGPIEDERFPLPVIIPLCLTGDEIDTVTWDNLGNDVKLYLFERRAG